MAAAVPKEITTPEEKKAFIDKLTKERYDWDASRFQSYTYDIFKTALAAQEASGEKVVSLEIHPPEIPHIRIFTAANPPSAPAPPAKPKPDKPKPKPPTSGTGLILD